MLLLVILCTCVRAQTTQQATPGYTTEIELDAYRSNAEVRLKWHATDPYVWALGRRQGYLVQRREVRPDGTTTDWTTLNPEPLREAGRERWIALVRQDSMNNIYPSITLTPDGPIDYLGESREDYDLLATVADRNDAYTFVLMATDLSYDAAKAAALAYVDATAEAGKFYDYRVRMAGETIESKAVRKTNVLDGLPELGAPTATGGDRIVTLEWPQLVHVFRSYDVYRRSTANGRWERINTQRQQVQGKVFGTMSYRDSVPDNETEFFYAIRGYDRFGHLSEISRQVRASGTAPSSLPDVKVTASETAYGQATVSWEFLNGETTSIDYVEVHRAYRHGGGTVKIAGPLSGAPGSLTDSLVRDNQYYSVRAYDLNGYYASSPPHHVLASDTIAPAPPTNVRGVVDTAGVVGLTWNHPPDADVIGYRVFFSNGRNRTGNRITDTMEVFNVALDTLNLRQLPDTVFYRVVALDERENVSHFSEPFALALPDLTPPDPPRLRTFTADTNGVTLTYAPSSSEDVVRYAVERRAWATNYWQTIAELPATRTVSSYTDAAARSDLRMEYRMVAFDDAGLRRPSNVLIARKVPKSVYPAVTQLNAEALTSEGRIRLAWNYTADPAIRQFRILRAAPDAPLTTYRTVAVEEVDRRLARRADRPAQWRYFDTELRRDSRYVYAVQPVYASGALGRLGDTVAIDY